MALTEAQKRKIEEEERYRVQFDPAVTQNTTHALPALLSFFIPGLGQIVKDELGKGILVFIGFIIGTFMLVIPGIIIWIWQIIDAYNN